MKKNYFKGIYYKFITKDGFSFAIIDAFMKNGKVIQVISPNKSYVVMDTSQVNINDNILEINVSQKDLTLKGNITIKSKHPLRKDVMGILRHLPIECKHNIYSMYGDTSGNIAINETLYSLNDGVCYIEGDEGSNFPKKYIWMNALDKDYGFTLAIANISLGRKVNLMGSFVVYKDKDQEINFSTLNGLKIMDINESSIVLKRGRYLIRVQLPKFEGKVLLAPKNGIMSYFIHEAIDTNISLLIKKKHKTLLRKENIKASVERVDL